MQAGSRSGEAGSLAAPPCKAGFRLGAAGNTALLTLMLRDLIVGVFLE